MTLEVGDLEDIYIITKNTMGKTITISTAKTKNRSWEKGLAALNDYIADELGEKRPTYMSKADMLKACDNNKSQMKVTSFMIKMASQTKKAQEETWKWLESLKFKDEDDFITRIRWNVSSTDIGSYL